MGKYTDKCLINWIVANKTSEHTSDEVDYDAFIEQCSQAFRSGYVISKAEWEQLAADQKEAVAYSLVPLWTNEISSFAFNAFAFNRELKGELLKLALQHYLTKKQDTETVKILI